MADKSTLMSLARAFGVGKVAEALMKRDKKNTKAGKQARKYAGGQK